MDGENDATQGGQPETGMQAADAQATGNAQDASSSTAEAQEVDSGAAESAAGSIDAAAELQTQISERDARIAELEAQIDDAAKSAEATEALKSEIEQLKSESEGQRIDFELKLAGCRSTRAARALLDEHDGDIAALKEAEPWLFLGKDVSSSDGASGTTGLKPAGTDTTASTVARWERLAGLTEDDKE